MTRQWIDTLLLSAAVLGLSACGGGGGGGGSPNFTPAPPPSPPPPASPAPLFGIAQDTDFAAVSSDGDLQIRWDQQAKTYEVLLPNSEWAAMVREEYGAYDLSTNGAVIGRARIEDIGDYDYTGVLTVYQENIQTYLAAFGTASLPSDIPVTGTASYSGILTGTDNCCHLIYGDAKFDFNFGAGTLAGYLDPIANGAWSGGPLGRYDFVNTVYSTGSTSFSGGLLNSGNSLGGTFSGIFNGPGAAELMGRWQLEFDMCATGWCEPGQTGTASGVVVAKKP